MFSSNSVPAIDRASLDERLFFDAELLREVAGLACDEIERLARELDAEAGKRDSSAIAALAHELKGVFGNVVAVAAEQLAEAVCAQAHAGPAYGIGASVDALRAEAARVREELLLLAATVAR